MRLAQQIIKNRERMGFLYVIFNDILATFLEALKL